MFTVREYAGVSGKEAATPEVISGGTRTASKTFALPFKTTFNNPYLVSVDYEEAYIHYELIQKDCPDWEASFS